MPQTILVVVAGIIFCVGWFFADHDVKDTSSPSAVQREISSQAVHDKSNMHVTVYNHIEQPYMEAGYQSVFDAIRACELHQMERIYMPIYIPSSIEFSYQLARCDTPRTGGSTLEVIYLDEQLNRISFMIIIRPEEHKLHIPSYRVRQTYQLEDRTDALYSTTPEGGYQALEFERAGHQYILISPTPSREDLRPEELVKTANSVRIRT